MTSFPGPRPAVANALNQARPSGEQGARHPTLDGALAAALERVARVAATSLSAPTAAVLLTGDDRRCFTGGASVPAWLTRDPGALFRLGLAARVLASSEPVAITDLREQTPASSGVPLAGALLHDDLRELGAAGFLGVRLVGPDGSPAAILCVLDTVPRAWGRDAIHHLAEIGASVTTELELQRRIVEAARIEKKIRHDALHDALTGLPNRACFVELLRHSAERWRREKRGRFAVLFLDLDNFKAVNDSYGHLAGDELLAEVSRRLATCLRSADTLARLGGDEFALLVEDVNEPTDVVRVAERLQGSLAQAVSLGDVEVFTSASIGIALSDGAEEPPQHLLRSADLAMYRAKEHGRARFEMFDPVMHEQALKRLKLETDLRRALEREQLLLYYQPVLSLDTRRVVASEALLRWNHPDRGRVMPLEFVPVAERTGLIVDIGRWVLERACRSLGEWQALYGARAPRAVWVNVSAKQFSHGDLARQVEDALRETACDPRGLKLEITESILLDDIDGAIRTLGRVRDLGVQVYMDDFGTGYSSLTYLARLPLDGIKIDRSFVRDMDESLRQAQLVRTIVTLVRNLGLEPIAEGVETQRQVELLREMGCDLAQGFVFSPAVPSEEFVEFLKE